MDYASLACLAFVSIVANVVLSVVVWAAYRHRQQLFDKIAYKAEEALYFRGRLDDEIHKRMGDFKKMMETLERMGVTEEDLQLVRKLDPYPPMPRAVTCLPVRETVLEYPASNTIP